MKFIRLISVKLDKRIFTLFCALQIAEVWYFKNISLNKLSAVGQKVKSFLKDKKIKSLYKLKEILKKQHPYYFIIWMLQHSSPPALKIHKKWEGELPLIWYKNFGELIRKFYSEANVGRLWEKYEKEYIKEIKRYQKSADSVIQQAINYLKVDKLPFKEAIFIPNLLDRYGAGYGPTINKKAYIIFGPSKNNINIQLVRHEFLHSIINPLVKKCGIGNKLIQGNKKFLLEKATPPSLKYYDDLESITNEYIIRAIEGRFVTLSKRGNYIKKQTKLGFPLIGFFDEQLKDYERSGKIFSEYLYIILENIKIIRGNNIILRK